MKEPYKSFSLEKKELHYKLANQFLSAGERTMEKPDPMPFASIVNLAFAAELFFKFISERKGRIMKGHRLDKLFNGLDDDTRNHIVVSIIFSMEKKGRVEEIKNGSLTEMLRRHSNLFEDYRYLYQKTDEKIEKNGVPDFGFLLDLNYILKGFSDTLRTQSPHRSGHL